jgi:ligand-binding SRPBCC domain-containing protein
MSGRFRLVTDVRAPIEAVFDTSLDLDVNLAAMARYGQQAVGGRTSGRIGLGETVTWQARHLGVPFRLTSRIVELDRPTRFVDEQIRGPFAAYRHLHRYEPSGAGTRMIDVVTFTAPLGPLGRVAERVVVGERLRTLIVARNQELVRRLEGPPQRP